MAMIKCAECGAEISDDARACPKCGYRKRVEWINTGQLLVLVVLATVVSRVIAGGFVSATFLVTYLILLGIGSLFFYLIHNRK